MNETTYLREKVMPKLRSIPFSHWEKIPGSPFNVGLPDVIGGIRGYGVVFEAKKWDNRKPTDIQRNNLFKWSRAGFVAFLLVFPKDKQSPGHLVFADTNSMGGTIQDALGNYAARFDLATYPAGA